MILQTLNMATMIVVAWLLWQQAGLRQQLAASNQQRAQAVTTVVYLREELDSLEKKIDEQKPEIAAALSAQRLPAASNDNAEINSLKAEITAYQAKIARFEKSQELKQTLEKVMSAELLKVDNPQAAAEALLGTKEVIWRTSTEHKSLEQTLQSLMAPIDILAAEWSDGYVDNSVSTIHNILTKSIVILDSKGTTTR